MYGDEPGPHALAAFGKVVDCVSVSLGEEWRAYGQQPSKHAKHAELCNWAACMTVEFNR